MKILQQALDTARRFRPLSATAVRRLLARTRKAAGEGKYELFKTSSLFDSTAEHPQWLGKELERLQHMMQGEGQRLSCGASTHCYRPVSPMDWMRRYGWRLAAAVSLVLALVSGLEPRGFRRHARLKAQAESLAQRNAQLREENLRLTREVEALQKDPAALERAAREELGFVKPGEIVIHLE